MNYKESALILDEIKKAKRILLNCHRGPDPDSIGSVLAMSYVLTEMGKSVGLICPSETLPDELSYLRDFDKIKSNIDFATFDFSSYDLFIAIDSSDWSMVSSSKSINPPSIPIVVIDHHHTNTKYGMLNLIDSDASSMGELINDVFEDWNVRIDKDRATALLTGIIGDTGIFKYPNTSLRTFKIASKLMEQGADKNLIISNLYRNYEFNLLKFCGEVLNRTVLDKENKFIYSAIPYEVYESLGKPDQAKDISVDMFAQSTKGTNFGFEALESTKDELSISLRGKTDFDTSLIASELGGGGHKAASGAKIFGLPFDEALEKVLEVSRKYAKEYLKRS